MSRRFPPTVKLVSNLLKTRCEFRVADTFSETFTIAEKHGLELVHHNVRDETSFFEATPHCLPNRR